MEDNLDLPWRDQYVAVDPLLREPLDLYGAQARRRHLVDALFRRLELDEPGMGTIGGFTERLLFDMIEPLLDTLEKSRVDLNHRARMIAMGDPSFGHKLNDVYVLGAMFDLHWSNTYVPAGSVVEVTRSIRQSYIEKMQRKVLRMLRHFEREGWLQEASTDPVKHS